MDKKRILIIEDDSDYLDVLTDILKKEDYEVAGVGMGFDVIEDIIDRKPDMIITDLMLPYISGEQIAGILIKNDVIGGIPIIVISSKDENEIREAAGRIDAVGYLRKPVDTDKLLELIKDHIK
ncbi:MAG: response regulator [Elusimicrobiota bacterium]